MKKFLCLLASVLAAVAVLVVCSSCGASAKKIGDMPDITKGYFAGFEEGSKVDIDVADYVDANGTKVTYVAKSGNTDIATVEMEGSMLTATLQGDVGSTSINITVYSDGKKAFVMSFSITANIYERVACIGDSLTYGHSWHDQSYPVYLQQLLGDVEVKNFGVNGSAVTNRSESSFKLKYDTLQEYSDSIAFEPDIVVIMLGSNDGFNWKGSEPTFVEEYEKLIDSYFEAGAGKIVLLTSPPTLDKNAFNLPNDVINANVCPLQRELAEKYSLPLVDLRKAFEGHENMQSLFRPGDGVHFSVEGAQFVAGQVSQALAKL